MVHLHGLDGIVQEGIRHGSACHDAVDAAEGVVVLGIGLGIHEPLAVVVGEDIHAEGVLGAEGGVHLVVGDLTALGVGGDLAHDVGAVVGAGDGGDQLGGEGVVAVAEHGGDRLEHVDAGEVHMPQEGEEVALKDGMEADIVLQKEMTREADLVAGAPVGDRGEEGVFVEIRQQCIVIVTNRFGCVGITQEDMDEVGHEVAAVAGGIGVLHVAAVGQDGVEGHFGVVLVADGAGVQTLIDVAAHERGLVGEDGLDLTDLGGDAARSRVHVGGNGLGVQVVGIAEEGGHGIAVGHVDVAAGLVDVVDAMGAFVEPFPNKAKSQRGGVCGVLQGDGGSGIAAVGGVGGAIRSVFVGLYDTVSVAGVDGGVEEVLVTAGEVDGGRLAGVEGGLDHDHRCRFKVGVFSQSQTACAAAGVAVLVVDPQAHTHSLALVGHEGEDLMLLGVLEVVAGADVVDNAAEAAGGNVGEVGGDNGLLLVEGGLSGVGEVVDDLQGKIGGVRGHGGAPFLLRRGRK